MNLKKRILELVDFIEIAHEENKRVITAAEVLFQKVDKEKDEDAKQTLGAEYFAHALYTQLLMREIDAAVTKLSECYMNATLMKQDLKLSEEETKVVESYLKQQSNIFSAKAGKIVPLKEV